MKVLQEVDDRYKGHLGKYCQSAHKLILELCTHPLGWIGLYYMGHLLTLQNTSVLEDDLHS